MLSTGYKGLNIPYLQGMCAVQLPKLVLSSFEQETLSRKGHSLKLLLSEFHTMCACDDSLAFASNLVF